MTEKKLYDRLMLYKSKHGVTQEIKQNYLWALETLQKKNLLKEINKTS